MLATPYLLARVLRVEMTFPEHDISRFMDFIAGAAGGGGISGNYCRITTERLATTIIGRLWCQYVAIAPPLSDESASCAHSL
jgi:hypothetical protein